MAAQVFQGAGEKPGLQIWRVEKMTLNPVPKGQHGSFYTGDAYIVLCRPSTAKEYNVHSWAGIDCSVDERGAAAIFMTQMDDYLGGVPRQFTEFQNEESPTFTSYFKSGIKYTQGGVASGFTHVETNVETCPNRLFQVKGRRVVRATEMEFSWDSFNTGDCFIIDMGKNIYHWSGSESNRFERLKTTVLAVDIRDNERKGRAEVHMIEEGNEPAGVINALGPKPELPPGSSDTEVPVSKKAMSEASLYMISDAAGSMKATLVAEKNPFKQDMLNPNECFIVDNGGNRKIFVWKGQRANTAERKAALMAAQTFIKDHNYSSNTQVVIMPAGSETTLFKDFFRNWMDKDESVGYGQTYTIGRIAKIPKIPFDPSSLHNNKQMAAQHGMVDDCSGKVQIWRVEGGDKVPVDPSTYGQFYGGDCYLVLYSYNTGGRTKHLIYIWQGKRCSRDELGASAYLTVQLDNSMGGVATQVRVTQGQEPAHLVSIFKGKPLIVYLGGTSRSGGQTAAANTRLFHIRMSSTKATRAVEVDPTASSLNTNDVFVLKTPSGMYLWKGMGASDEEMGAAKYVASLLGGTATEINEKKEPDSFWSALGGRKEYKTSKTLQKTTIKPPRLFGCSNKTGRLIAEEVPGDFSQLDLATDDIMILDAGDQIYVWIGKDANEEEKSGVEKIAQDYINTDPSGRRGTPILTFKQGEEPPCFTGWFHDWDSNMWDHDLLELASKFKGH